MIDILPLKGFQKVSSFLDFGFELLYRYFRVEFEGLEHVPQDGPAVIIANHSGYAGTDAIVLFHLIKTQLGREPRIMAHRAYFEWSSRLKKISLALKLRQPHVRPASQTLRHGHLMLVFPEGEAGNFKSTLKRYRLQPFHSGFLRIARSSQTSIVPCLIIGAEESHFCLGSINVGRKGKRLRIPFPVPIFPLPAKWKVKFLKPMDLQVNIQRKTRIRQKTLTEICEKARHQMQTELDVELTSRKSIFFT